MAIIDVQSLVDAPTDQVWARVVTPEGINDELRPYLTMSIPRGAESLTIETIPIGSPIGRCWMRLFGILPFDYDRLMLVAVTPGRGFHEESTMLSMRQWRHERSLTPAESQTVVRDVLTFELRKPLRPLTPVISAGIRALFGHRHRRLQRYFSATG